MPPASRPFNTPARRICGSSMALGLHQKTHLTLRSEQSERLEGWQRVACLRPTLRDASLRDAPQGEVVLFQPAKPSQLNFGLGKTPFTSANASGAITWISPLLAWSTAALAPSFWPLTNLVGP